MKRENIKTFAQGAFVGAIVSGVGMFWCGFAVSRGSAESMAAKAQAVVVDHPAPICAVPFPQAANPEQLSKDLKAEESRKRTDLCFAPRERRRF